MSDQHALSCSLPSSWDPQHYEPLIYQHWIDAGYFTADPTSDRPGYCVVLPPPNVTGSLHMGHALDHTLMDGLTRRKRMQGYDVLWLPGMDHAGIATQNVVEKHLATQGLLRTQLTRQEFIDQVWDWKAHSGGTITTQMRRLGDGVDWSRERFTMDEQLSYAVGTIFKRLYDAGLIYQAERLVNWSPVLETAISDLEVTYRDIEGELISFRYGSPREDQPSIVVATTRLETILGDSAIAVHPDDARYAHLIGCMIEHPLMDRAIPIIADESVDPDFGTGAVKITPAHDPNDFEVGLRHGLPMPTIFDTKARICDTGTPFDGMDRFQARAAIREHLATQGRIVAEKRPYLHSVGHSERSGEPIEPRLSLQWWVKVSQMATQAGQAVRTGQTRIYPPSLESRWFSWVDDMHDWCISRQLWWGHRIPVWYGPEGQQICCGPHDVPPAGWVQDPDVLDTWFSSALWPFSTLGWPHPTPELAKFYPTDVLVTGYDILFFWVARMMMFATFIGHDQVVHPGDDPAPTVPFRHIFLHGLIRDEHGKKMSKSRGNGIDPLEWVDQFGADALRFSLARAAHPGADLSIGPAHAYGSRNFITKLFNATRFALLRGAHLDTLPAHQDLTDADRWILTRLEEVRSSVDEYFDHYEFAKLCDLLYHFIWDEVCDWYLELAKTHTEHPSTPIVLATVLDVILRLLHPIIPFVTEVLWQALTGHDSIVVAPWPGPLEITPDPQACQRISDMQKLVTEIRRFRSDQGLIDRQKVPALIEGLDSVGLGEHHQAIITQTYLSSPAAHFAPSATIEVALSTETVRIHLGTSEVIDVDAERRRLEKDLAIACKDLATTQAKLANEQFLAKAPQAIIDKIRDRHQRAHQETQRLKARLEELS